jgi:hypothetical protein
MWNGCGREPSASVDDIGYSLAVQSDGSVVVRTCGAGSKPFVIGPFASEAAAWAWIAGGPAAGETDEGTFLAPPLLM